ncbi:hypothetical protein [Hymenobacter rubidus]|uniref:hypothetical protein n=1 Tax=Hymenobacter rubidus TaxID=1441626 RepID=UPI00191E3454|nr:hypothetical protein [Hymenobacter rubidus]
MQRLKYLLALGPELPPRLWLTGLAIGLAILSLIFRKELWPHHRQALSWNLALLALLLLAAGGQTMAALKQWAVSCAGPAWLRLLIRAVSTVVSIGIAILMMPLLVVCLIASLELLRQ